MKTVQYPITATGTSLKALSSETSIMREVHLVATFKRSSIDTLNVATVDFIEDSLRVSFELEGLSIPDSKWQQMLKMKEKFQSAGSNYFAL
ncbi:MAG: hypothetical protein ACI9T7_003862 [Oleiphilaceae bacterium]|jgi:hypothetical protein